MILISLLSQVALAAAAAEQPRTTSIDQESVTEFEGWAMPLITFMWASQPYIPAMYELFADQRSRRAILRSGRNGRQTGIAPARVQALRKEYRSALMRLQIFVQKFADQDGTLEAFKEAGRALLVAYRDEEDAWEAVDSGSSSSEEMWLIYRGAWAAANLLEDRLATNCFRLFEVYQHLESSREFLTARAAENYLKILIAAESLNDIYGRLPKSFDKGDRKEAELRSKEASIRWQMLLHRVHLNRYLPKYITAARILTPHLTDRIDEISLKFEKLRELKFPGNRIFDSGIYDSSKVVFECLIERLRKLEVLLPASVAILQTEMVPKLKAVRDLELAGTTPEAMRAAWLDLLGTIESLTEIDEALPGGALGLSWVSGDRVTIASVRGAISAYTGGSGRRVENDISQLIEGIHSTVLRIMNFTESLLFVGIPHWFIDFHQLLETAILFYEARLEDSLAKASQGPIHGSYSLRLRSLSAGLSSGVRMLWNHMKVFQSKEPLQNLLKKIAVADDELVRLFESCQTFQDFNRRSVEHETLSLERLRLIRQVVE